MAILTRYLILANQTTSSPSYDSIATQEKRSPETHANILARSNGRINSYCHFDPLVNSGRPDLLFTE
jgi:hypothetical protein